MIWWIAQLLDFVAFAAVFVPLAIISKLELTWKQALALGVGFPLAGFVSDYVRAFFLEVMK